MRSKRISIYFFWGIVSSFFIENQQSSASPITPEYVELRMIEESTYPVEDIYSKNPLLISVSCGFDHPIFDVIKEALQKGNQLKIIPQESDALAQTKQSLFKQLNDKNVQFYFIFKIEQGQLMWKMYNVFTKSFVTGKSYKFEHDNFFDVARTILIDIWETIFGEGITPFNCFLTYLETSRVENTQYSDILFTQPLIGGFLKKILMTKNAILDLGKLPTCPFESLLFSIRIDGQVDIVSFDAKGNLSTLIKNSCMAVSPSVNNQGIFYICSGKLFRFYFNRSINQFVSDLLDVQSDYVSVYAHPKEQKLLIAKNKKIYEMSYDVDPATNKIFIERAHQVSDSNSVMANGAYDGDAIVASERINGIYQLVCFENNKKYLLTLSDYHKQDPAVSPCGTYIAYVAQMKTGERYIETINRFTGVVIRITELAGEYRFPVWVIR